MAEEVETNKPAWIDSLEEAKNVLREANQAASPADSDAKLRIAYGWIEVARLQKNRATVQYDRPINIV